MTQKLEKRTFIGIDITPRFWLWDEITRLDEECNRLTKVVSNKQDECNKKQARIEQLEALAGTFAHQRNESDAKIRTLEAQIRELSEEINASGLRITNADQPRVKGVSKKMRYEKPSK